MLSTRGVKNIGKLLMFAPPVAEAVVDLHGDEDYTVLEADNADDRRQLMARAYEMGAQKKEIS